MRWRIPLTWTGAARPIGSCSCCGLAVLVVAAIDHRGPAGQVQRASSTTYVRVVADLVNVGDGLPQKSDVKYHGVLVGAVDSVIPAANGDPNFVHIDLNPEYAGSIPAAVTARVVPSNVFAVSSVQLVDRRTRGRRSAPARTSPRTPSCRPCCSRPPSASCATCWPPPGGAARTTRGNPGRGQRRHREPPGQVAHQRCTAQPPHRPAQLDRRHRRRDRRRCRR